MTITIHETASISLHSDIEESVRGTLIEIGANCVIDSYVKIKPTGGQGDVVIGERSVINSGCVLYSGNGIRIGRNVLVAANCTFAATNHEYRRRDLPIREQGFRPSKGGIVIEDDVWIGSNCVILDGAHIRQGVVVGAGSVVRGELTHYGIFAGNPIQQIGVRG